MVAHIVQLQIVALRTKNKVNYLFKNKLYAKLFGNH